MKIFRHRRSGFGLIEILVTLGVLSVGILGVTTLLGVIGRQSSDNKARAEALSIAQSRIEEMRNYTQTAASLSDFNTVYADTTGYENSTDIDGTSASFTRTENISTTGTIKDVIVKVDWTDPSGDGQSVTLNTEFSFISPRKVGDAALEASPELVDSPTGRARLGDGTLTTDELDNADSNGDGTQEVLRGNDRLLAVGNDVVLTLVEACQTDVGTCADFVRINGTVYIDRDQLPNLAPGSIHVIASDAAYCSRHYIPTGSTEANRTSVTDTDTSTVTTSGNTSGEYEYFDYTCYLGGGWHGNVGILIAGNSNWDGCVGDPTTSITGDQPIRASRRVYRGMLYKEDPSEADGKQKVTGSTTLVQYYSQGVGDSAEFPVPASGDAGHDFVITGAFSASQLGDPNPCLNFGPMTRTDSNINGTPGDLFALVPDDFFCFNLGYMNVTPTLDVVPSGFGVEYNMDFDTYPCPFNPADPPAAAHIVSGSMTLSAPDSTENDILASGMRAFTSDGIGSCSVINQTQDIAASTYTNTYECTVFDWSETVNSVEVFNGWDGYIEVDYDQSSMSCDPNRITLTGITNDSSGNDFINCSPGSFIYFTGTVISAPNNRELSAASISDAGGSCTVAVDGLSFSCLTDNFPFGTTDWTGTLTLTSDANVICTGTGVGSNPAVFSYTNEPSGFVDLSITLANNTGSCP